MRRRLEEIDQADQRRPTVEGSRNEWLRLNGPVHAPTLAGKETPAREWAVEGLIPMKSVTLLSGDGGTGKSTLALQLVASIVLGRRWLGIETRGGTAAYVSCEDDLDELHRRLAAICSAEDWEIGDLDGLQIFPRVGFDSSVIVRGERFGEFEDGMWWCGFSEWLRDNQPQLVVLDSLYDFFTANQLEMAAARAFMGRLRAVANDAGCAILVLWHPSKSGMDSGDGTSGNVAFRNAARAMLYLEKDKDASSRDAPLILRGKKSNYGPVSQDLSIKWEKGRFVPLNLQGNPTGIFAGIERRQVDGVFLELLETLAGEGRPVSASRTGNNYAPTMFSRRPDNGGYKKTDFEKAMERLFSEGKITTEHYGRKGDERRKIVRLPSPDQAGNAE
jgi:RecA-family ATPase